MTIRYIGGKLVEVSSALSNLSENMGNNSFSGIPSIPVSSNVLSGYSFAPGQVPFGSSPNPLSGQPNIPNYIPGSTLVKTPLRNTAPATTTNTPRRTIGSTTPTRIPPPTVQDNRDASGLLINPPGAMFDRNTGNPLTPALGTPVPPPGSMASLYQAPAPDPFQAEVDRANAWNESQFNIETDQNTLYQKMLTEQQASIDAINSVYNDKLNNARVQGQGRLGSTTAINARSGLLGSDIGQANTNNQQDANTQVENAIQNEKALAIQSVFSKIKSDAVAQAKANTEAKRLGADAIIANAATKVTKKKTNVSNAVKALAAKGVDANSMTAEELESFTSGLGVTKDDFLRSLDEATMERNKALAEQQKLTDEADKRQVDISKTEAEIDNLLSKNDFDAAQKALDRALEDKKINVQWYNAKTSRMGENRQSSAEKSTKNYDGATIPISVKSDLIFDLTQNMNASKKEKKTLQDFFAQYPEVNTKYLQDFFEANQ